VKVGKDAVDQLFDVIERDDPDAEDVEVVLRVHVQPGAGRSAVVGRHGDAVTIKVAAPPEGGRANEAVIELLATSLGLPASRVTLVSGATSRSKRFRVGPVGLDVVRRAIAGTESGRKETGAPRSGNVRGRGGVR
jgi:uncharacterized protein (TIGR00251 family)